MSSDAYEYERGSTRTHRPQRSGDGDEDEDEDADTDEDEETDADTGAQLRGGLILILWLWLCRVEVRETRMRWDCRSQAEAEAEAEARMGGGREGIASASVRSTSCAIQQVLYWECTGMVVTLGRQRVLVGACKEAQEYVCTVRAGRRRIAETDWDCTQGALAPTTKSRFRSMKATCPVARKTIDEQLQQLEMVKWSQTGVNCHDQ